MFDVGCLILDVRFLMLDDELIADSQAGTNRWKGNKYAKKPKPTASS
jgi:hypothetical protein